MKPGSVWTRVNHQYPDQVGGEIVVEKGTPVQVKVHRVDKEGVSFEILNRPGTISYLSWPDPLFMWVTFEPNKITIENRYGPLLTYTRADTQVQAEALATAVIEGEDPKDFLRNKAPKRFVLTVNDFCDQDDFLNALWALGHPMAHGDLPPEGFPPEVWELQVPVKAGEGDYYINRDIIHDWKGLMNRLGEPEDLDEIALALDQ